MSDYIKLHHRIKHERQKRLDCLREETITKLSLEGLAEEVWSETRQERQTYDMTSGHKIGYLLFNLSPRLPIQLSVAWVSSAREGLGLPPLPTAIYKAAQPTHGGGRGLAICLKRR